MRMRFVTSPKRDIPLAVYSIPSPSLIHMGHTLAAALVALTCAVSSAAVAQASKDGVTYRSPSGSTLRLLLDDSNVGSEVSVGELTFPPNSASGGHQHGAIEMLYLISGELEHVVNGKSEILKP